MLGLAAGAASSSLLLDFEITMSASKTTPSATANTTRPEGPCFLAGDAGATGAGATNLTGAGI
ncbi:unannotated protein [freshwater metagenome]|uniref:Unannotated protein n=1 Tax=freshwater metagenome TaxID=449393 RepID=A0A6J7TF80_9ZZZZ